MVGYGIVLPASELWPGMVRPPRAPWVPGTAPRGNGPGRSFGPLVWCPVVHAVRTSGRSKTGLVQPSCSGCGPLVAECVQMLNHWWYVTVGCFGERAQMDHLRSCGEHSGAHGPDQCAGGSPLLARRAHIRPERTLRQRRITSARAEVHRRRHPSTGTLAATTVPVRRGAEA